MRGRGRDRWGGERAPACGLGCGGDLGHISPHSGHGRRATFPACLLAERGKRGPVPGWDGTFESILFPMDCTEGSGALGTTPAAQDGVAKHPPFREHKTSSRGHPLPTRGLLARGTQRPPCLSWSGAVGGRSQRRWRSGRAKAGSGGERPLDLHPSSLQADPLSSLVKLWPQLKVGFPQEGRAWGTGPFGTVLVALFGDFVPSPEGRDRMGEEGSSAASFLSVLCLAESVLHVSFCLTAGAQLR